MVYVALSNGRTILPRNLLDCPILCSWNLDNSILADEPFTKALRSFETCVLVNNNLYRKLISSLELPTTFEEIFKVPSVPFFILQFWAKYLEKNREIQ